MPSLTVIYWRDIPAQVVAEEGRGRSRRQAKQALHRRFALAIDEAAMRANAGSTDDYLAEWRKAAAEPCGADLEAEVAARVAQLEQAWPAERLGKLVASGGFEEG